MPELKSDLRREPWNWRNFGGTWVLTTRSGGAKVVLGIMRAPEARANLVVRKDEEDSRLIDLTPDHPIARILEEVPGLFEIATAVASKQVADGEDLTVDAARALIRRIDKEKTDAAA